MHFVDNDNYNIIKKIRRLLYIYNRCVINLKNKYFFKYYYITYKLKLNDINNNAYNKKNYKNNNNTNIILLTNIKRNKEKKNIIIRERNISNDNKQNDTNIFPINNIYNKYNFYNPFPMEIYNRNKDLNHIKKNYSYNYNNSNSDNNYLGNFLQDKINTNQNSNFMQKNIRKNKVKSINKDSINFIRNNKTFTKKNNTNFDNMHTQNNIIINYINEMDNYNKIIMKQKSCILTRNRNRNMTSSGKKKLKKSAISKRTISCFDTPLLNNNSEISMAFPYSHSNYNNKIEKFHTDGNKIIISNNTNNNLINIPNYSLASDRLKPKNIVISPTKENKMENINFAKYNYSRNRIEILKTKIKKINNSMNKDIINKMNSNSLKKNIMSAYTYKKENDYYYPNSSNYFRQNSFVSKKLFTTKSYIDNNSNKKNTTNKSNTNIFSPLLVNRINRKKIIAKSNLNTNKLSKNLTNYKNRNYRKKLINDINYSLSTNYKEKQNNDETRGHLYINSGTGRKMNITTSNRGFNQNNNNIFGRNKNLTNINSLNNNLHKNYNYLNYRTNYNNIKGIDAKKYINNNFNNIPISSIKKANNHILQNISFSNNSSDKYNNDNLTNITKNLNKANKKINSAITNNNYLNLNKFNNYNNIKISSLFSILKEDKNINDNKNEYKPKDYSCINIINECFENKNKEKDINNNQNINQNKNIETSFESLSDSKIYELAKSYIPKEEILDKNAMEQILKNKKNILNK